MLQKEAYWHFQPWVRGMNNFPVSVLHRWKRWPLSSPPNCASVKTLLRYMGSFTLNWFVSSSGGYFCSLCHLAQFQDCRHAAFIPRLTILRLLKRWLGELDGPVWLLSRPGPHCECMAHCETEAVTAKSLACRATGLINQCTRKFHLKALAIGDLHQVAKVFYLSQSFVCWSRTQWPNCFESLELPVQSQRAALLEGKEHCCGTFTEPRPNWTGLKAETKTNTTTSDVGDTEQPWKIDAALRQKNTPPDWSTLVDLPGVCVLHTVQHNSKRNMSRTRSRQNMEWHWVKYNSTKAGKSVCESEENAPCLCWLLRVVIYRYYPEN